MNRWNSFSFGLNGIFVNFSEFSLYSYKLKNIAFYHEIFIFKPTKKCKKIQNTSINFTNIHQMLTLRNVCSLSTGTWALTLTHKRQSPGFTDPFKNELEISWHLMLNILFQNTPLYEWILLTKHTIIAYKENT